MVAARTGVVDSVVQNNLMHDNHASGISLFRINGATGSTGNLVVNNTILNATDGRWCVNINNGSRLDTYVIPGEPESGILQLNGAAARHGSVGDLVILICYAHVDEKDIAAHKPKVVLVDSNNKIVRGK